MKVDTILQSQKEENMLNIQTVESLRRLVCTYLNELGAPPSLRGYNTAAIAIPLIVLNDRIDIMEVYGDVATQVKTTRSRIERNLRTLVDRIFSNAPEGLLDLIFRNSYSIRKGKPTNKEFLYVLAYYIRLNYTISIKT